MNLKSGELHEEFHDFTIAGRGRGLTMGHSYNSIFSGTDGPLGYGWTSDFLMSLGFNGSNVSVNQENGSQVTFTQSGTTYVAPTWVAATMTRNGDGTWKFVRRGSQVFNFSAAGRLTSISDPIGGTDRTTIVHYDVNSHVDYVQDGSGRRLNFAWTGSHIHTITDQASPARTVRFEYSGAGDLVDVFDVAGGNRHFTYDTSHHLTRIRSPHQSTLAAANQKEVVNDYDGSGRVYRQTDELGRATLFDYTVGGQTTVTDPNGEKSRVRFDNEVCSSITLDVDVFPAKWTFEHDPITLGITKVTDPIGRVASTASYDAMGNTISFTDGAGNTSSANYNQFNEPNWTKDGKQVQTTFTYETDGRLKAVSTPLLEVTPIQNRTVQVFYDTPAHPGDATRIIDPNGKAWLTGYNSNGYVNALTDPLGNKTTYQYDTVGRLLTMVTPKGNVVGGNPAQYTWTYEYNAFGDLTSELQPPGAIQGSTITTYDENRNIKTSQDAELHITRYFYDDADQLTQELRADGSSMFYDYWPDGLRKSERDGANQTTTYTYDALGRMTALTDPLGRTTSYEYFDQASSVVGRANPGGQCYEHDARRGCSLFTFDAAGRLTSTTYDVGPTFYEQTNSIGTIDYDANGRRVGANGNESWTWDSLGRMTSSRQAGVTTSYGYDLAGHLRTLTYPQGTVTRNYDDAGRYVSTSDWLNNLTQFGYDQNSNLNSTTFPSATGNIDTYGFDQADRLMTTTMKKGATTTASLTYDRYKTGLLKAATTVNMPGTSSTYAYNSLNQLTTISGVTKFGYDSADNLVQMMGATFQQFDVSHQLCWQATTTGSSCSSPPAGATTFNYDLRGNRSVATPPVGAPTSYVYDEEQLRFIGSASTANPQGQFTPLTITRVGDTRAATRSSNCGASGASPCTTAVANGTMQMKVAGLGGVPSTGVNAVVLNVTSIGLGSAGYLKIWADDGSGVPTGSTLNYPASQNVGNSVTVKVSASGLIRVWTSSALDLLIDVEGWYASSTATKSGTMFYAGPTTERIADTRPATATWTCGLTGVSACSTPAANATTLVRVVNNGGYNGRGGTGSLPMQGMDSVLVNVTAVGKTTAGYMKIWTDDGTGPPSGTQLNFSANQTISNTAIVKVGKLRAGAIQVWTSTSADFMIDVQGWFAAPSEAQSLPATTVTPLNPTRVIDTRNGTGTCTPSPCARLAPNATVDVRVGGQGGVPTTGVSSVIVNITGANPAAADHLTAYSRFYTSGLPVQPNPNVYFTGNATGMHTVRLDAESTFRVKNGPAAADFVVDVVGYYTTPTMTTARTEYDYNAGSGLRRTKQVVQGGSLTATSYTWSQADALPMLIAEATGANTTSYMYGPDGLPVEQITSNGITNTVVYYHHDQLGSTRLITNAAGNTLATYTYDPYGKPSGSTGTFTTPFGFTGEYRDSESGLIYLRNRYYDPPTGQFLTRDPLASQTHDPYGYASRDPLDQTDPSGLCPDACVAEAATAQLVLQAAVDTFGIMLINYFFGSDDASETRYDACPLDWILRQGSAAGNDEDGSSIQDYISPPQTLPAFPDAGQVPGKTRYPGGIRKRWKDKDGNIYEWDYQHGTVEKYNRKGKHLGEFDPNTGKQIKGPNPSRKVEP